jgi:hypothetical protein
LSIIIVSWNAKAFLQQCVRSVHATTRNAAFEVVVVDNGSGDGSAEMIHDEFPAVRLIQSGANLGFAAANNLGIEASRGRYLCLINPDVVVLAHCLDRMCDFMEQNPSAGLLGPKILNPDKTLQISCYGFPSFWNGLCHALGLYKVFPRWKWLAGTYRQYWPYDKTRAVDAISGCFCMARREAVRQVGLLDASFFMYMEDFDWCKRMWRAGWQVVYHAETQAIHHGGGSTAGLPAKYMIERNRAMLQYWRKHHGRAGKWFMMFLILIRQSLRGLQGVALFLFKPASKARALPIIKGSLASVRWLLHTAK